MWEANGERFVAIVSRFKAELMQQFDLSNFPFDRQYLGIKVNFRGNFNLLFTKADVLKYFPGIRDYLISPFTCRISFALKEFSHSAAFVDLVPQDSGGEKHAMPATSDQNQVTAIALPPTVAYGKPLFYCVVQRQPVLFYRVIVIPMSLIMMSAYLILLFDPVDDFSDRANLIFNLFITLVAMKFVIAQSFPQDDQETILDEVMKFSFLLLFVVAFLSAITYSTGVVVSVDYGESHIRVLDLICGVLVTAYVIFLQLQFLLLHARLGDVLGRILCCQFVCCPRPLRMCGKKLSKLLLALSPGRFIDALVHELQPPDVIPSPWVSYYCCFVLL